MDALQKQHIVDLYAWVDDTLQQTGLVPKTGRTLVLRYSELITILIWPDRRSPTTQGFVQLDSQRLPRLLSKTAEDLISGIWC